MVIPLALQILNIAAQIYLVCFPSPSGMFATRTAPYTQRLGAAWELSCLVQGGFLCAGKSLALLHTLTVTEAAQHGLQADSGLAGGSHIVLVEQGAGPWGKKWGSEAVLHRVTRMNGEQAELTSCVFRQHSYWAQDSCNPGRSQTASLDGAKGIAAVLWPCVPSACDTAHSWLPYSGSVGSPCLATPVLAPA